MTRNAPAPIRPVIVLLLVNLALSAVLALLFVLFRGPLVDHALGIGYAVFSGLYRPAWPEWEQACQSCTAGIDERAPGLERHLAVRDTTLAYVSLAPIDKIERYRAEKGWTTPWYSSQGSDVNVDFGVTVTGDDPRYNYASAPGLAGEMPGMSCLLRDGDRVFHTYSNCARAAEWTGGSYAFLDLTALGRQEDWEEPKGRADLQRVAQPDFAT